MRGPEFIDGAEDGVDGIRVLFKVVAGGGAVADFYGVGATTDFDDGGVVEVGAETLGIDGGAGDDELQVGALGKKLFEITQEEIDVEAALVRFVDDEGVVVGEEAIVLGLGQENPI